MTAVAPRVAGVADQEPLRRLLSGSGLPLAGLDDAWRAVVVDDERGLAGCAALERFDDPAGPVFLLRSVAVRSDRRAEGLGQVLVRAALAEADRDADGVATAALLTETAVGYFERFGFRGVPRDTLPTALVSSAELSGACPDTAVAYLRP